MDQSSDANLAPEELKAGLRKLKVRMTEEQEEELVRFADKDGDGEINFNEFWLAMHVHVDTEAEQEEDDLPLSTELQCQGVVLYRVNELHLPRLAGVHEDFGEPGFPIHTSEHWSELIQMRPWAGMALRQRLQVGDCVCVCACVWVRACVCVGACVRVIARMCGVFSLCHSLDRGGGMSSSSVGSVHG